MNSHLSLEWSVLQVRDRHLPDSPSLYSACGKYLKERSWQGNKILRNTPRRESSLDVSMNPIYPTMLYKCCRNAKVWKALSQSKTRSLNKYVKSDCTSHHPPQPAGAGQLTRCLLYTENHSLPDHKSITNLLSPHNLYRSNSKRSRSFLHFQQFSGWQRPGASEWKAAVPLRSVTGGTPSAFWHRLSLDNKVTAMKLCVKLLKNVQPVAVNQS